MDERYLTCIRCRERILVCCHVADVNPATYVGVACGCRQPKTEARIRADRQVENARRTNDAIPF